MGDPKQLEPNMKLDLHRAVFAGRRSETGKIIPTALAAGVLCLAQTHGEGFRNPPPGAFNLGRAGGRIAHVDDSSAVAQNPANLVDLEKPEVQFTPSVVYIKVDYESPSGDKASTENPWKILPNLFAGMPFYDNNLALGFGITTPYGLANEWATDTSAFQDPMDPNSWRYHAAHYAALTTINFRPAVAVRAGDYFSLGAGLDVMWSKLSLRQNYPWAMVTSDPSTPDGSLEADSTGAGVGANFGLTVNLPARQRFAVTVQTPIRIDYSGDATVSDVPAALGGGKIRRDFATHIKYPLIVSAGYGIQLTDTIRLETDVEWLQFSSFKSLPLEISGTPLGTPAAVPQNWNDTFTIGIGGDWKFAPNWVFRAGYRFYESPVPDSTFSPTIPDANQNVFTFGLGYTYGRHSLEGAYGLDIYDQRNISNNQNPAFNGTYDITVHLFSLAYRFAF